MSKRFIRSLLKRLKERKALLKEKRRRFSEEVRRICGGSIKDGYYHITRGYTRLKDR